MTDFTGKFMEGFTEEVTFELDSDSWVQQRSIGGVTSFQEGEAM